MITLGHQERILGIQGLSKRIAHGRLSITPLEKMAMNIFFLDWISLGDLFNSFNS